MTAKRLALLSFRAKREILRSLLQEFAWLQNHWRYCHFERSEKSSRQGVRFFLAGARRNDNPFHTQGTSETSEQPSLFHKSCPLCLSRERYQTGMPCRFIGLCRSCRRCPQSGARVFSSQIWTMRGDSSYAYPSFPIPLADSRRERLGVLHCGLTETHHGSRCRRYRGSPSKCSPGMIVVLSNDDR